MIARRAHDVGGEPGVRRAVAAIREWPAGLGVRETDALRVPALCGLLRPVVLLPVGWAQSRSAEELHGILCHEVGHLRRLDIFWRWLFLVARAVHWFNPVVWLAERSARINQEMACDAWVILRGVSPAVYGESLLLAASRSGAAPHVGMAETGLAFRIRHLAAIRAHDRRLGLLAIAAAAGAMLLAGPVRSESGKVAAAPATPSAAPPSAEGSNVLLEIESKFLEVPAGSVPAFSGKPGSVSAVLSEKEFNALLRSLDEKKGIDLLSAPKVAVKSGQAAKIEIVREFRYPTDYDPPSRVVSGTMTVVTPATPTQFEMRNVGVTLEVTPEVLPDRTVQLSLKPQIVEFEGFINYAVPPPPVKDGDPLDGAMAATGTTSSVINQPVFAVRSISTVLTLMPGQTVVLGGMERDEKQTISDRIEGKVTEETKTVRRAVYIFVTPRLVPAGPETPKDPVAPVLPTKKEGIPYGTPVPDKPGFVTSPFAPEKGQVDLRGFAHGTEVKCPYTEKIFLVP